MATQQFQSYILTGNFNHELYSEMPGSITGALSVKRLIYFLSLPEYPITDENGIGYVIPLDLLSDREALQPWENVSVLLLILLSYY